MAMNLSKHTIFFVLLILWGQPTWGEDENHTQTVTVEPSSLGDILDAIPKTEPSATAPSEPTHIVEPPAPITVQNQVSEPAAETEKMNFAVLRVGNFNVFEYLPKVKKPFHVFMGDFTHTAYGPYQIEEKNYTTPLSFAELKPRIKVLRQTLEAIQNADKEKTDADKKENKVNLEEIEYKVHLADLLLMMYQISKENESIEEASLLYEEAFPLLSTAHYDTVALNLANCLIEKDDFVTALPVLKKLTKDGMEKHERKVREALLEVYFLAGRYQKADEYLGAMIKNKEVERMSHAFQVRAGDVQFFLKRYQDAMEWYPEILKPDPQAALYENVAWLYLAESILRNGNKDTAKKIYTAMKPYFKDTVYEPVIDFRLTETELEKQKILAVANQKEINDWMRIEIITDTFEVNPHTITSKILQDYLDDDDLNETLKQQALLLQAYTYLFENKFYKAVGNLRTLALQNKNTLLAETLDKTIEDLSFKEGMKTKNADQALDFMRYINASAFTFRDVDSDALYHLIAHNLEKIGLEEASAEVVLHIIDKSVHPAKEKSRIYLKLAGEMYNAHAYRQAIKMGDQIEVGLLNFEDNETFNRLKIDTYLKTDQTLAAIAVLDDWAKNGSSAYGTYWTALKKVEIYNSMNDTHTAMEIIDNTIGDENLENLPANYRDIINSLEAHQVILFNKTGKHNECLTNFYEKKDRLLKTEIKYPVIMAALSAAIATNKNDDVEKLLLIAKTNVDKKTYSWLEKWSKGEMWISQVNDYLGKNQLANNNGDHQ